MRLIYSTYSAFNARHKCWYFFQKRHFGNRDPLEKFETFRLLRKMTKKPDNKEILNSPGSSTISINIIQNGSFGFYRSVCLATDHVSYMFNCPDTNRRVLAEQGVRRPPLIKHIFFTHGSWENISGLPGLTAFLKSSSDVKEINLRGPFGLTRMIQMTRLYNDAILQTGGLKLEEFGLDIFEDSNVLIESVPLLESPAKETIAKEYVERRKNGNEEDYPCRAGEMAVAYICKLKPKYGKVILEKCVDLGLDIGPAIGKLQRGSVVTNRHGRQVHPHEVMEPPLPPEHFAVIECPSQIYLEALNRSDAFSRFHSTDSLRLLIHFTPKRIMETDIYQNWMNKFPPSTLHWICNDSSPPICHLDGVFRTQTLLNGVNEEMFPLLWHHRISSSQDNDSEEPTSNVIMAKPFTKFSFRPPAGIQSLVYPLEEDYQDTSYRKLKPATAELEHFHELVSNTKLSGDIYPTITFFGTASASPTKHRNVSGICLQFDEATSILFDCGESTISQMQLFYGPDGFERRVIELKAVFISHLHLDHIGGLYSLILKRKEAFEKLGKPYEKLIIVAATPLLRAHQEFSKHVEDTSGLYDFYPTAKDEHLSQSMEKVAGELGVNRIEVVKVIHPQCATGFVVVTKDEKKIVYSGDTRPCDDLVKAGRDADLLIHEATLNDGWENDAVIKKHCTKSEAIAVSKAMNAKWTILTHFTGINSKVAYVDETILEQNPTVGMAHDFMIIRWEQLELVPKITPILYAMFADYLSNQSTRMTRRKVNSEFDVDEEAATTPKVARMK